MPSDNHQSPEEYPDFTPDDIRGITTEAVRLSDLVSVTRNGLSHGMRIQDELLESAARDALESTLREQPSSD